MLCSHALKYGSILVCNLAGTHTYTHMHIKTHTHADRCRGTECLVNSCGQRSLGWVRWEVVVAFSDLPPDAAFDTDRRTDRQTDRQTDTQRAAARCRSRAPKANAPTHRELTVSNVIFYHRAYSKMTLPRAAHPKTKLNIVQQKICNSSDSRHPPNPAKGST